MKNSRAVRVSVLVALLLGLVPALRAKDGEPDYTKGEPPSDPHTTWSLGSTGALGHIWKKPRKILIDDVEKGSPADGKLQKADVILGVLSPVVEPGNGSETFTADAHRVMAAAIEEAEKGAGEIVLNVWRPNGKIVKKQHPRRRKQVDVVFEYDKPITGKELKVTIPIKVLGAYSATSPWNCKKTEVLIDMMSELAFKQVTENYQGIWGDLAVLGVLATGEKKYIEDPAFIKQVRKVAASNADKQIGVPDKGVGTWHGAYVTLMLTEYYLATRDEQVLPAIRSLAEYLSLGVSGVGTWGHGVASVELNGLYGPPSGYGAMNQAGLVVSLSLVLAQKCGVTSPAIDKAVRMSLDFPRYYMDKGCIPYGDHEPKMYHDNNGRMSIAAVLYDIAGQKEEAEYFTHSTLASHKTRERGHTGHFFSWQWGALGAARGGPEAAHAFMEKTRYFTEMERRFDGNSLYQGQLGWDTGKYRNWNTTGSRLIALCLPRKQLYITGKSGTVVTPITGDDLKKTVVLADFQPQKYPTETLLKILTLPSPITRNQAAEELGNRDDNVVKELIAMLESPNRFARYGACQGLKYAGRKSEEAVRKLAVIIEKDPDRTLRHFAVDALQLKPRKVRGQDWRGLDVASRLAGNTLLKVAVEQDPRQDATGKLTRQIAVALAGLFNDKESCALLDRSLLIPAMKVMLTNPNGQARASAGDMLDRADLPTAQLDNLWTELYEGMTTLAPSGVMFGGRHSFVRVMARNKIEEGREYGIWYACHKRGWGAFGRRGLLAEAAFLEYGGALKPYREDLESILRRIENSKKRHDTRVVQAIRPFLEKLPTMEVPELISIQAHIKNEPEPEYQKWLDSREMADD